MKKTYAQAGFSAFIVLVAIVIFVSLGFVAWRISQSPENTQANQTPKKIQQKDESADETARWTATTTQGGGFNMRIPDGWKLTRYPGDYLGAVNVIYRSGTPAIIEDSSVEYFGHLLRFRASITALDDAGLGPQWASPQPGLQESTQAFQAGTLSGKRFKGVFSQDLNQTLYEYVFDIGSGKKLDIVYTVYHAENEKDDVAIIEKAIKTINLQ
jgi:hypothetical protein